MRGNGRRTKINGWFYALLFWCIFVAALLTVQQVLSVKSLTNFRGTTLNAEKTPYNTANRITGFYALPHDSLDAVFLGSSVVYCGANPDLMYHEYGFSSYNFSVQWIDPLTTKYMLAETFRTQKPKAVVLDVTLLAPVNMGEGCVYGYVLPYAPASWNKLKLAVKLPSVEQAFGALVPLWECHWRWNCMTKDDLKYLWTDKHDALMGFAGLIRRDKDYVPEPDPPQTKVMDEVNAGALDVIEYARKLCDQNGATLILISMPEERARNEHYYPFLNAVKAYALEEGVSFINYNEQLDRLDFAERDIADMAHLTLSGAKKMSLILGEDMRGIVSLPDHRGEAAYAYMDEYYQDFTALVESLPNGGSLDAF